MAVPAVSSLLIAADAPVRLTFDSDVAIVALNRPAVFNAIDLDLLHALRPALDAVAAHAPARVLLLCGHGSSFCSGGDIGAIQRHADDLPAFLDAVITAFHELVLKMARLRMPIVCAVQGTAAGGGVSLALAADLVIAARSARFVVAYPKLGTSTDGGLSFHLQQRLGPARALALLTHDEALDARAAHALGLVHDVMDDDALAAGSMGAARRLAALPPQAVAELRALVHAPSLAALEAHLSLEREAFLRCARAPEFAARVDAFARRRVSSPPPAAPFTATP